MKRGRLPPAPPAIPADMTLIDGPDGKLFLIPEKMASELSRLSLEALPAEVGGDRDPLYYAHRRYRSPPQ